MVYTILVLIAVSGLIAYLGDWLGRRMGKRRLRLFGMRPRYTAIVVTTFTGMVIATLTLGTLLAIDSTMREVVLRGKQLVRDNDALAFRNEAFEERNHSLHDINLKLLARSTKLTNEVQTQSEQVATARKQAQDALAARDRVQLHVRGLERLIEVRQRELASLRRTGKQTEHRLKTVSSNLVESLADLSKVKTELDQRNEDLVERQRDLEARTQDLAARMAELAEAQTSIRKAQETIKYNEDVIREQKEDIDREAKRAEQLYTGDVVLPQGQEIARNVIDTRLGTTGVREALNSLLDTASGRAKDVEAGAEGDKRAIRLVFLDSTNRGITSADENVCIDEAVKTIAVEGRNGPVEGVLARVTVVRNTLKGEPALVDLQLAWNRVAFKRGDRIAKCVIDGKQSEGRVLLAVLDFLRQNVRSSAQRQGVVPVATPDPDKATEPISDEQLDNLIELVQTIRETGKQVELRAVAEKDIFFAGPINLDNIGFTVSTVIARAD